jgi:hypothetical protein
VESLRYDLVVVEDLGRICRRNRAVDFCEMCEDADTRLIALAHKNSLGPRDHFPPATENNAMGDVYESDHAPHHHENHRLDNHTETANRKASLSDSPAKVPGIVEAGVQLYL